MRMHDSDERWILKADLIVRFSGNDENHHNEKQNNFELRADKELVVRILFYISFRLLRYLLIALHLPTLS